MTERHDVRVGDGDSLAVVSHAAPTDRWLVFCHGFRSDKSGSYERRCRRAVEEGYNAVRFDFRGCGESSGAFVDQTLSHKLADLRAVVDYFDPDSYALFGSSFGGKVAFHAAATDGRVEAVATRAPVTHNRTFETRRRAVSSGGVYEFDDGSRIDGPFFDDLDEYPFERVVDGVDVPVAVFHGARDESVDIGDSTEAARRLETDVLLEKFADEGHLFSDAAETRMQERLFDWLPSVY